MYQRWKPGTRNLEPSNLKLIPVEHGRWNHEHGTGTWHLEPGTSYVLGALFSPSLFDQRAPEDHVLITCFVGGARAPELAAAPENELIERTLRDLKILLGVTGSPAFTHVTRWPRAIPQYDIGYRAVKDHLRELENRNPGLLFAGNYLSVISVAESIKSGKLAAERASQYLQHLQERA